LGKSAIRKPVAVAFRVPFGAKARSGSPLKRAYPEHALAVE